MKLLFSLIFFFITCYSFAQRKTASFSSIDARAEEIDSNSPDTLSYLLTSPYSTELEKVRSIFFWITDHISYNTIRFQPHPVAYTDDDYGSDYDRDSAFQPLDERVARIVLKKRCAFCDGYARLFKDLCDHAGIKSEVITGYARTNMNNSEFHCNHKWNAVMIDSNWYLLDATWASGYLSLAGNIFIKDYNDNYFLTPPKYFIDDHYPDDVKWTLLNDKPSINEFYRSPFKQPAFNYKIISYSPSKGVINASVGDTIKISLETTDDKKDLCLLDIASVDSANIEFADSLAKADKNFTIKNNRITAQYIVSDQNAQWLQVIYNREVVLRYKLNIKKEPFPYAPLIIKDIVVNN
jgi:transglutaminase/protease-like cytokinesis protein 3